MIFISRKVDYGILALHSLAGRPEGANTRELAATFNLSRGFLANILKALCQEGLVEGQRGVNGGYRLARPADRITLDEIITALDGPFQLMACVEPTAHVEQCGLIGVCPVRSPMHAVHERMRAVLCETTLADLASPESDLVPLQMET